MDKSKPKFRPLNILTKPPVKKGEKPVTAMAANGLQDVTGAVGGIASMVGQFGALAGNEQLANTGNITAGVTGIVGDMAGEFAKRGTKSTTPKLRKGAKSIKC